MDISKNVRSLLRTVAKDFAEAEGIVIGHLHFLAAMNHISNSIRQEFDGIVTGGLFHEDSEQVATSEPAPAPAETAVEADPDASAAEQPADPAPAPEAAPVAEAAAADPAPAEKPAEPVAEATATEQPA